jgi:putative Holliday junction resolvase
MLAMLHRMKEAGCGMHKRFLKNFISLQKVKDMGRILAIDYGQKRTGLAVSDELKLIATALETVPTMEVIPYLKDYILENPVECFVVGEPKQMDNSPSQSARFVEPFVKQLMKTFPCIRLERMDERFTSLIASRAILESGLKKMARRDKSLVDTVSATLILQSFMESERIKKEQKNS